MFLYERIWYILEKPYLEDKTLVDPLDDDNPASAEIIDSMKKELQWTRNQFEKAETEWEEVTTTPAN